MLIIETVKKAYEEVKAGLKGRPSGRPKRPSLLDPFKQTIDSKLELNCSAASIFKFIQKKGFTGSYTLVKDYCRQTRRERVKKATIRIEHSPGLSAQVDWKEEEWP
jgi:transposase